MSEFKNATVTLPLADYDELRKAANKTWLPGPANPDLERAAARAVRAPGQRFFVGTYMDTPIYVVAGDEGST